MAEATRKAEEQSHSTQVASEIEEVSEVSRWAKDEPCNTPTSTDEMAGASCNAEELSHNTRVASKSEIEEIG